MPVIVRQAGGIVVRPSVAGGAVEVLVVTARRHRKRWILPKGAVEDGETAEVAAMREVREEGGVAAEVLQLVGTVSYPDSGRLVRVRYFLMRFVAEQPVVDEGRKVRWLPVEDAIARLAYGSARRILVRAVPLLGGGE
jgi:8-oxo-dGTP pyrophosphatase MutT (NUDIX family)